jgi:hypothetical protein
MGPTGDLACFARQRSVEARLDRRGGLKVAISSERLGESGKSSHLSLSQPGKIEKRSKTPTFLPFSSAIHALVTEARETKI